MQCPVVGRPIGTKPGIKFNLGLFFLYSKVFSRLIFSVIFRVSNHELVDKRIKTEMLFKLSNLNSNLALTLGCLNPALNNSAHFFTKEKQIGSLVLISFFTWRENFDRLLDGGLKL